MPTPKLELYKFNACPFCQKVMMAVDNLNIDLEYKDIAQDPEALKFHEAKTGRRTTPCLYIDGEPLFESSDIIDWLEKNRDILPKKG